MIKKIKKIEEKLSVIGVGYVGLPLAVAFAEKGVKVTAFDVNETKIQEYKDGHDATNEIGNEKLQKIKGIQFTSNPEDLKNVKFHIIAVPTPILQSKIPDLAPIKGASTIVGKNLVKGSIVVYESTVYPGATEEVCVPILERESGLKYGIDFKVGYSPERINPGDKVHRVDNITKITSGMDVESAEKIAQVYELIIKAGVHRASSIKVAEAAKVIENSQRDINIAFMNELSLILDKMDIDTKEVLEAAGTKWNFLPFRPGLVGGHCIGVDPYYLAYKAGELGHQAQVILAGRNTNDGMGKYIAEKAVKKMIATGRKVKGAHVMIMGITFKENCPDLRNSKVVDIINELKEYEVSISITDPIANHEEALKEYGIKLENYDDIRNIDAVIIAVNHKEYHDLDTEHLKTFYKYDVEKPVIIDVKDILDKEKILGQGYEFWRL